MEVKIATQRRNQMFKEIEEHIKKNSNVMGAMIVGEMNQSVGSKAV